MSNLKPPPYILQELPDITESINYPIKNVQRIKYTCFDVSKTLIAFGATSGGIYVFNRNPCEFVQLIPNKDGAITRLAISSNEKHIGFANGRGTVTATACDQSLSGGHSTVTSKDHHGNEVTTMMWNDTNMMFSGDDVGKISVLQMQNFLAKTFQSSSQVIMSLDSRICQIDLRSCMLLVSTLTRCYVCDTTQEQYRQIGQKLRDGEFGACFVNKEKHQDVTVKKVERDFSEVKKFNMVNDELKFAVGKELENTLIFCARPSSRLWESTIEGTVKRTHQFKQVLARRPFKILTVDSYKREDFRLESPVSDSDGKSINFSKIFAMDGAILCFRKDALYFLNIDNVDDTVWYEYNDVVDCKVYHNVLYIWLNNGSLIHMRFMKIDKFLLKCFVEEKYLLCAEICAEYNEYLMSNKLSPKLHIVAGLGDKIKKDMFEKIEDVLNKFESLKLNSTSKTGIHVLDNTYNAKSSLDDDDDSKQSDEYKFSSIPPEAMQTLKDLSLSVSGKLNSSKKILKEKWDDFEDKMKHLGDKPVQDLVIQKEILRTDIPNMSLEQTDPNEPVVVIHNDIIYKESSQKVIEIENIEEKDNVSKSLYQYFRLSLVSKEQSNLASIIESNACDIREIYNLMLKLQDYCVNIGAIEESKFIPNHIFLSYLSTANGEYLKDITENEDLYKYFVDSCISVNMKTQKLSNIGCECGFPLPYARTNQTPAFSGLIDKFIEIQWSSQTRDQCYDICKRMPYLWRKILYLRRNEDLMNILRILLQMLDEKLLHSFLPQFTLDIWNRAVQLYATLYANICLNCSKKFENISVKDMLSWDDLGSLMIKSVGGRNALKVLEKHANLIDPGAITMKFYHTCLVVTMFEKIDANVTNQLTDAVYSSYDSEEAKNEICKLLRSSADGDIKNTAIPITVAANSNHWGLTPLNKLTTRNCEENLNITKENEEIPEEYSQETQEDYQEILEANHRDILENNPDILDTNNLDIVKKSNQEIDQVRFSSLKDIVANIFVINKGVTDCALCGLPLQNEVLINDGGLWVFKCGHTFHGACLGLNKVKLCPSCLPVK